MAISARAKNFIKFSILFFIGAAVGLGAGMRYNHSRYDDLLKSFADIKPLRDTDPNFKLIQPLLSYRIPSASELADFGSFENSIKKLINDEKSNGNADQISLYFNALNEGRWIGVGESDKYNPASLMKVLVMIAYFKESETNAGALEQKFIYSKDINNFVAESDFMVSSDLKVGQSYTAQELIKKMIINSDNGAMGILAANINQDAINNIYDILGIQPPDNSGNITISPRGYSLFFRILYNATYLDREMSEQALELLTKSDFKDGLLAGVPPEIDVAHKFGEYIVSADAIQKGIELHDCGIVYYEPSPYFLCVMTKGKDLDKLKNVIKDLSGLVFQRFEAIKEK